LGRSDKALESGEDDVNCLVLKFITVS